jgi:predicted phage tail protein
LKAVAGSGQSFVSKPFIATANAGRRLGILRGVGLVVLLALTFGGVSSSAATTATPDQVGQWSSPVAWPNVAVHVSLEPNGQVLSFDAWNFAINSEYLWNPTANTFDQVLYGRNLFCSGHTVLGTGKTLIVGGNTAPNDGTADTTLFDPATNTFSRGPDMSVTRWYPTATEMADGRVFVYSGDAINASGPLVPHAFKSTAVNSLPSVYDPASNTWTDLPGARLTTPLYPFIFTLTDGRLIDVGPDTVTRTITPGQWTWQTVAASSFDGGSAVQYRPDKIMKAGSYSDPDFANSSTFNTVANTAVLDMTKPSPTWRDTAPMASGRAYHVLTMLPDGKVLATGGGATSDGRDLSKAVLAAEQWDPDTESWTTMASEQTGRLYHSTALLLPDARVLVAGGGRTASGDATNELNAEIYSPPYLFKGTRPTITSAPASFDYSGSFTVSTPDAAQISKVSLIKLGSMTHAINMSQRFTFLNFTAGSGQLTVQAPSGNGTAPPGTYMLFLMNANGVPSVASMIKTSGVTVADTTAPTAPSGLSATGGAGFVNLSWGSSTDNVGVAKYDVYRSTTPGFTPSATNRVAQVDGTTYADTGVATGTYFYVVKAEDAAGNLSPSSNQASATVASDTTAPTVSITAPAAGATVQQTVTISANAADNSVLAGVQFKLDGTAVGAEDTAAPYSIQWDTTTASNGPHTLTAVARDGAGNSTTSGAVNVTLFNAGGTSGLVAAYGFDEGAGTTLTDLSGSGNNGSISGATWAGAGSGKFGNALSFNGSNNVVTVPDSATLDLTTGMTLEAWVRPTAALNTWRTVVMKEQPSYYAYGMYAGTGTGFPSGNAMIGVTDADTRGTAAIPQNAWTHMAATYDGNMLSLFVNGVRVSQLLAPGSMATSNSALKIGGNAIWGEFFSGLIDEVRIYNKALTLSQINGDMIRAVTNADSAPPSAPGALTATGSLGQASLSWAAATDDTGVVKYDVYRSTTSGFSPSTANRVAQPTGLSFTDTGLAAGTYYYRVQAEDGVGNVGPSSNEAAASVTGDTTPPTVSLTAPAGGATVSATVAVSANASDNGSVANVQFKLDGGNLGSPDTSSPYSVTWDTTTAANGQHSLTAVATDGAGNQTTSSQVTVNVSNVALPPPTGLAGAYGFDEGAGTTTADQSGSGGNGTLTNATWAGAAAGKFGNALSFNGTNASVSIPDTAGLHFTTGMTLEAWVKPTAFGNWNTVLFKERTGYYAAALYANTGTNRPSGNLYTSGDNDVRGSSQVPLNAWTHLAVTYDGSVLALYVNGVQAGTLIASGSMISSTGALKVGGNAIWGEYFNGLIDEVRAYGKALTATQIQADMAKPVTNPDSTPPGATGALNATGGLTSAQLTWGAATDNVGVTRYDVYRSTTSGFTPGAANRVAQPAGLSYTDAGLAPGTYYYRVQAEDAAGNLGASSNEASAVITGDTQAPTAPGSLVATAGSGQAALTWTGSTDNVAVTKYDVYRSTTPGFTPAVGNRIAQPTVASYTNSGLTPGTYYYRVAAEDAAGNISAASNEASATVLGDTTPPVVSITAPAGGSTVSATVAVNASATDNGTVANVQFKLDGASLGAPDTSSPYSVNWDTTTATNTQHTLTAVATDAAGNSTTSATVTVTVGNAAPSSGLVAAYGFDEGTGTAFTDQSGTGNNGTAANTTWAGAGNGKFGNALSFNGTNAMATVPDSASLHLSAGETMEAWVKPTSFGNWNTVLMKERTGYYAAALYANTAPNRPSANVYTSGDNDLRGTTQVAIGAWTHLAATYDGTTLRLYVNGALASSQSVSGAIIASTGALRIGGNSIWGEYFNGLVDEVRIYNKALTAAEITTDMNRPVTNPDSTPPSAPGTLGATGGISSVQLSWGPATDNVGVTRYDVYRSTSAGFTPTAANRIAQPTGTSYTDASMAPGTFFYRVQAEDAAGNLGTASNEASAVVTGDTQAPSAPASLTATAGSAQAALSWTGSADNVGVTKYDVYRSTASGFTPAVGNRIAQPAGTSYTDAGLTPGTYYYRVAAEDAAGNVSAPSNETSATVVGDTTPPTVSVTAPTGGSTVSAVVAVTANASDNGSVANVQFKLDGNNLGSPDTSSPYGVSWDTGTATNAQHTLTAVATDAAGNTTTSATVTVTVSNTAPTGLVAAYGFDEGAGTTTRDLSGNNNNGTLNGATWAGAATAKFGNALTFNGLNNYVSVPDSASLDLTTGMTLEAWVRPTAVVNTWRTVVMKENSSYYAYGMYAGTGSGVPSGNGMIGGSDRDVRAASGISLNTWTHVAATYDGTAIRIFVNGVQSAQLAATGAIATSTAALKIGGNAIWGEYFAGQIDEVRVYNKALTAAQLLTDMNTPVAGADTTPPSTPAALTATGSTGQVALAWSPSTDNVAVQRYDVYRSTTPGFTASAANRIAQPAGTSYTDSALATGTYYYRVQAEDLAGNLSGSSNEANASVTADTSAPTVPSGFTATGAAGQATLAWTASTDNVSVARYDVYRSTSPGFVPSLANRIAQPTTAGYTDGNLTAATYYYRVAAEDPSGNTSAPSAEASAVVTNVPVAGLVAAYAFDEGSGTSLADGSGRLNTGTIGGTSAPTWTIGKRGAALQFDGLNDWVTVPDASSLDLTTGMTLEAWIYPTLVQDWHTVAFKEQSGDLVYGLYANDRDRSGPQGQVYTGGSAKLVDGPSRLPVNQWSHLAATYNGSTLTLYVNGVAVASTAVTGNILTSTGALRIGGNNVAAEWFKGRIDDVRVYNRALTPAELTADMNRPATADTSAPTVTSSTPAAGATDAGIDTIATVKFSEAMDATSVDTSTLELRDSANALVPSAVTYDALTATATVKPSSALSVGATYTVRVRGGAGTAVRDTSGNPLAADRTWTFSTEASAPPILVVGATTNPFTVFTSQILRAEGVNEFDTLDISFLTPFVLGTYNVVVLGDMPLTGAQVTMITNWVNGGGKLIALHPDKQLAGLLGLTDAGATLSDAYLKVDTTSAAGNGIVGQSIQYHGTADRYALNGATAIASLYSNAGTATSNPAVSLRSVAANGGQAAAFTYDLDRSTWLLRQGNPAWAGQNRDGILNIRPNDLFFGAKSGDVRPDWVDTSKIAIPQADEQQRLLVNLITTMSADKKPIPRFWYFPQNFKSAVVMTGDDHSNGGTAGRFDYENSISPAGCVVARWQCVRSTSYIYPATPLTNAQGASYTAQGFEVGLHPQNGTCADWTASSLDAFYSTQLEAFVAKYPGIPVPVTNRMHCVTWSDWLSLGKEELAKGVRLDTDYYHYPDTWIGAKPGFMTGSGFPMRFLDTDGSMIDVFQANTFMTDESGQAYPATANALFDNAVGPNGYYGFFMANMHTDYVTEPQYDGIVASAQAHNLPMITAKQLLDWTDGRNASSFQGLTWSASTLSFRVAAAPAATAAGLTGMVPVQGPGGKTFQGLTRGGSAVATTIQTIKGVAYATFDAQGGAYVATYGP